MRPFVIAMLALGALTLRVDAQTVKSAVGNEQVYWVLTVSVDKMDEFKSLVGKLVAATKKEPGALQYEYNVGDDNKTIDIYEPRKGVISSATKWSEAIQVSLRIASSQMLLAMTSASWLAIASRQGAPREQFTFA